MNKNILSAIFDYLGDALERFNPSAFRFLAAVLPYLTPIPVAWLTAHSSATFLDFTPQVSFIFVFALEGIGLWFTTMLVDAVVDFVRSKNFKSIFPVFLLGGTVIAYVYILVVLNVTLEEASGNTSPALSKVITLLCFLPLITGVGNGYYKLKLDYKTQTDIDRQRQDEKERQIRQESREERLERLRIKAGKFQESSTKVSSGEESFQESSNADRKVSGKMESWRKVREKLSSEQMERLAKLSPDEMKVYASKTGFTYKTISNWRNNARNELNLRND
jgi:hypothetical protein